MPSIGDIASFRLRDGSSDLEDAIAAAGTSMQAESLEALEEYWEQAKKTTGQAPESR